MTVRNLLRRALPFCSLLLIIALATFMSSPAAYAQGLELNGGWAHLTGNNGTDGFEGGIAWWATKRVTLAANYDGAWDTSGLTNFGLTNIGLVTTKSHLQNFDVGPRIFFSSGWTSRHKLNPFGEVQFGYSWLDQRVTVQNVARASASDEGFSWLLGGGAEYLFNPHWSGRVNLDFLRTHFADEGQTHFRLVLGVTYTIGSRGEPKH